MKLSVERTCSYAVRPSALFEFQVLQI